MDIFEYAKIYDADYFDFHTGYIYIYHVQDYNRLKRLGIPTNGIMVSVNRKIIGVVHPNK